MSTNSTNSIISFLKLLGKLKHLPRTGWVNYKVDKPETVASHMYRMAMISMLITDEKIDKQKCIKMSLVHDIGEAIVGDITPYDGVSEEDKFKMEEDALKKITKYLKDSGVCEEVSKEIFDLWMEYEENKTNEAIIVKDIDKFDMILQADEYETTQENMKLDSFFDYTRGKFKHPFISELADTLDKQRKERL
eukprot:gene2631-3828_t